MILLENQILLVDQVTVLSPLRTQLLWQLRLAKVRIQRRHYKSRTLAAFTPFHCQLDGVKHPATERAYQCVTCGHIICIACYLDLLAVDFQGCPLCQGPLSVNSVGSR